MVTKKEVNVKNRSNMTVVYSIPEMGIRREFLPGEVKTLTVDELNALSYRPGGMYIIRNNLMIMDKPTVKKMSIKVEPEYYLDDKGVIDLLQNGSMEAFLDCLDFAPLGVKDLIKKYAYELPVNDSRKREAIKEKLDFDVDLALLHKRQVEEAKAEERGETDSGMKDLTPQRRVKQEEPVTSGRRTAPKYKVVNTAE